MLSWEIRVYEFKWGHNFVEATKKICCMKGKGEVDHFSLNRWFKKFCLGCKNLDDQARLGMPKAMDSEPILKAIDAKLVSSTHKLSSNLESLSSMVCNLQNLAKSVQSWWIDSRFVINYSPLYEPQQDRNLNSFF